MPTSPAFKPLRPSASQLLFLRYISGQIAEAAWEHFTQAFDDAGATPEERAALAQYYSDAIREFGPEQVSVPKREEVEEFLQQMRVAAA